MAIQIDGDSGISGVNGSATTPALQGTDSNTGIVFGTDTVQVATGGSTRTTVDSSGNVGIGTASIASGGANTTNFNVHTPSSTSVYLKLSNSGTGNTASDAFDLSADSSGNAYLINRENGYMTFYTNASEQMRIDSSGNVGINETSPLGKLHVRTADSGASSVGASADEFVIEGSGHAGMTIVSGTDQHGLINFADPADVNIGGIKYNHGDNSMVFTANDAERVRIKSDGNTLMHGTSSNGVLNLNSSQSASESNNVLVVQHSASSITGGTAACVIFANGNIKNSNNFYGSLSDSKLKENIVDASSQWDDIKAIQVRNYNFKESTGQQTHRQLGVVAQELETVSPGLVSDSPDLDADGNDLGTVTKSVNYSVLYMKAVKALQEAQTRIETLETQHADLLARVTALEAA